MVAKRGSVMRRRPLRLPGYDYTQPGAYFVTLCTYRRKRLFGEIVEGQMRLNAFGQAVHACWAELPRHFPHVELDAFVIMPNHVHGVIMIYDAGQQHAAPQDVGATYISSSDQGNVGAEHAALAGVGATHASSSKQGNVGAQHAAPLPSNPRVVPGSLGAIIRSLKSAATRRINQLRGTPGAPVWQRNYYEHIIRDEAALNRIRTYIQSNPLQWHFDIENPDRLGTDDSYLWLRAQGARSLAKGDLP